MTDTVAIFEVASVIVLLLAASWATRMALLLGKMSGTLEAIRMELSGHVGRMDRLETRVERLEQVSDGTDAVQHMECRHGPCDGLPLGSVLSQP